MKNPRTNTGAGKEYLNALDKLYSKPCSAIHNIPTTTASQFVSRLDGVRETSLGQWIAKCPSHSDGEPSLSVKETSDGVVLIHCFAGCTPEEIVSAVGMNLSDLFPPQDKTTHRKRPRKKRPDYRAMWILCRRAFWILVLATEDLERNKPLSADDLAHVRKSRQHISDVMEVLANE